MKKTLFTLAFVLFAFAGLQAQEVWTIDPAHSKLQFNVTHLVISEVSGHFKKFDGTLSAPGKSFDNSQLDLSIDINSIDTENSDRDQHLRSEDFFYAEKFPQMTFKSKSFEKVGNNKYELKGDITLRGVTKPITLSVTHGGTVVDPYGNTKAGFKISGQLKRKEFGLQWDALTEAGGAVVGDEVEIVGNIQLQKQVAKN